MAIIGRPFAGSETAANRCHAGTVADGSGAAETATP